MSKLVRFGVSLENSLLEKFDKHIEHKGYVNRSEAFRDLIRQTLISKQWTEGGEVAGAIILIYDHHRRELLNKITGTQHDYQKLIISTQHVHLDHNNCLEIVAVRGIAPAVKQLADTLRSLKGVKHGELCMSSTGTDIE